jgi:mannose-6-phosphate isomerase-like protein (cupin superfamily)
VTAVDAPAPFKVGKVEAPLVSKGKISQSLARLDILGIGVQVVSPDGGETNLHSHPGMDSAWLVLDGEATFYTEEDRVVAELGRNEFVMIPAGAPYWFKATGDEPLVVLHLTARNPQFKGSNRVDYEPYREKPGEIVPGAFFQG